MTIFSTENLYKAYKDKVLFENLSFGMQEGERVGIIGKNGAGKSTLLKILSGLDAPDTGNVVFNKAIKTIFLDQMPEFNSEESILDNVLQSNERVYQLLEEHHKTCKEIESHFSNSLSEKLDKLNMEIDSLDGWNFENEAKKMLTMLGIDDYTKKVNHLSGGQKKRVAIAKALVAKPDFLILDEPTNHLDAESVQWLQDTLQSGNFSILFVTHDRYFLDALATKIIELDKKNVKHFPGNYEDYLITKAEQEAVEESTRQHIISKLRDEMEWLSRGVKARRTKQKSRIDWIDDLKGQTKKSEQKELKMEIGKVFLGSRIIDAYNISKEIGGKVLFRNFTYNAKPGDRIGIIGPNGSGKSTLMKIFCGVMETDSGSVKLGTSVKFGYFDQHVSGLNEDSSIIGVIREIGDYINVGVGKELKITARELLERFLFPSFMHSQLVRTLSGGEKRRLMLCRMLMANPNVLLLDEPTNDFDIQTLNALEEYLDYFKGTLISISHDRAFLDRTAEFIWAFDAKGNIKEYPGNYSNYLEKVELERQAANRIIKEEKKAAPKEVKTETKKKLSFKEQRELELLENELPKLEEEKMNLELKLNSFTGADYEKLQTLQKEYNELLQKIEEKEFRWLELNEH